MVSVDLKVGFSCNNYCIHCVNWDKQRYGNLTFEEIKREVDFYVDKNPEPVERIIITGGEPTIRPDIIDIVRYCKDKGIKEIHFQTNARKMEDEELVKKLVEAGLTNALVAVHGHTAELHDSRSRRPGSFKQTIKAMENLFKYNVKVATNTVISLVNLKYLPEIISFLVTKFPELKNLHISFPHPLGNAYNNFFEVVPQFTEAYKPILKAIDVAVKTGRRIDVESLPFCYMDGYEKYNSDYRHFRVNKTIGTDKAAPNGRIKDYGISNLSEKRKSSECNLCSLNPICNGVWVQYAEKYGLLELNPVFNKDYRALAKEIERY